LTRSLTRLELASLSPGPFIAIASYGVENGFPCARRFFFFFFFPFFWFFFYSFFFFFVVFCFSSHNQFSVIFPPDFFTQHGQEDCSFSLFFPRHGAFPWNVNDRYMCSRKSAPPPPPLFHLFGNLFVCTKLFRPLLAIIGKIGMFFPFLHIGDFVAPSDCLFCPSSNFFLEGFRAWDIPLRLSGPSRPYVPLAREFCFFFVEAYGKLFPERNVDSFPPFFPLFFNVASVPLGDESFIFSFFFLLRVLLPLDQENPLWLSNTRTDAWSIFSRVSPIPSDRFEPRPFSRPVFRNIKDLRFSLPPRRRAFFLLDNFDGLLSFPLFPGAECAFVTHPAEFFSSTSNRSLFHSFKDCFSLIFLWPRSMAAAALWTPPFFNVERDGRNIFFSFPKFQLITVSLPIVSRRLLSQEFLNSSQGCRTRFFLFAIFFFPKSRFHLRVSRLIGEVDFSFPLVVFPAPVSAPWPLTSFFVFPYAGPFFLSPPLYTR